MSTHLTPTEVSILQRHVEKHSTPQSTLSTLMVRYKGDPTEYLAKRIREAYYAEWGVG